MNMNKNKNENKNKTMKLLPSFKADFALLQKAIKSESLR